MYGLKYILSSVCLLALVGQSFAQTFHSPQNASTFRSFLSESGGAGNGGNGLISEFFREALVGLEILKISQKLTPIEMKKLHDAMKSTKVYPVEFQLCQIDEDTGCSDKVSYVAKNYPIDGTILLDGRDMPYKWINLSITEKRRIAIHEFAGIAGIEVANHSLTSQIDSPEIFDRFEKKKDLKSYFKMMNDLYFLLPANDSPGSYSGGWAKRTIIRPTKQFYSRSNQELLKGEKFVISMSFGQAKESSKAALLDYSKTYKLENSNLSIFTGQCLGVQIRSGELQCDSPNKSAFKKWSGTFKRVFSPSYSVSVPKMVPVFSCKVIDEDQLMCRDAYYLYNPIKIWDQYPWTYEYAFFKRANIVAD